VITVYQLVGEKVDAAPQNSFISNVIVLRSNTTAPAISLGEGISGLRPAGWAFMKARVENVGSPAACCGD
jgi:hypothetical protein